MSLYPAGAVAKEHIEEIVGVHRLSSEAPAAPSSEAAAAATDLLTVLRAVAIVRRPFVGV